MSDNAFLFHVLEDGKWHGQAQIIAQSMAERGCGITVHSRVADLRKRGCVIENDLRRNGRGRALSYYRLVRLDEPQGCDREARAMTAPCGSSSVPASASELPSLPGTLELFACEVDESAGQRGAYWDDAA